MKPVFIYYPKCSTCIKAKKWLEMQDFDFEKRDIVNNTPTINELAKWIMRSGDTVNHFFNTSGQLYRLLNVKEKIKTYSTEELISLLASNGMLIKRPILVTDTAVCTGFKEEKWSQILKNANK